MEKILQTICQNPDLEARWLHTLALLEYIGARKISKSIAVHHPPLYQLKHLADESRHAYAFKQLSFAAGLQSEKDYLCPEEAISYFQTLDQKVSEWITSITGKEDQIQNYLFVTSTIERRAIKLYPLYLKTTQNPLVKEELKQIIREEGDHKPEIEEYSINILKNKDLNYSLNNCDDIEAPLFFKFEKSLQDKINA